MVRWEVTDLGYLLTNSKPQVLGFPNASLVEKVYRLTIIHNSSYPLIKILVPLEFGFEFDFTLMDVNFLDPPSKDRPWVNFGTFFVISI